MSSEDQFKKQLGKPEGSASLSVFDNSPKRVFGQAAVQEFGGPPVADRFFGVRTEMSEVTYERDPSFVRPIRPLSPLGPLSP